MNNEMTMPSMTAQNPQAPATKPMAKQHVMVEVVGGFTLASTIVSGLAMWFLMVAYVLPIGAQ